MKLLKICFIVYRIVILEWIFQHSYLNIIQTFQIDEIDIIDKINLHKMKLDIYLIKLAAKKFIFLFLTFLPFVVWLTDQRINYSYNKRSLIRGIYTKKIRLLSWIAAEKWTFLYSQTYAYCSLTDRLTDKMLAPGVGVWARFKSWLKKYL